MHLEVKVTIQPISFLLQFH